MEEFFDQEKTLAKVYFLSENDEKNKLLLSEEKLLVIRKNHRKYRQPHQQRYDGIEHCHREYGAPDRNTIGCISTVADAGADTDPNSDPRAAGRDDG